MSVITKETKQEETFAGKPKKVSWERLWTFSGGPFKLTGWPKSNTHTDPEVAKRRGLPTSGAASGTQFHGYAVQLMIALFGVEWLSHGMTDVKFIGIVDAGDTVVAKAMVTSKEAQDGATKFTLDVYCENQRGEKVLVGLATGLIGEIIPSWAAAAFSNRLAELMADSRLQPDVSGRYELEPLEYVVTPELNQQYLYGEEDFRPCYIEDTEIGPPIAHPALILNWSNSTRSPSYNEQAMQKGQRSGLHARDEAFFCAPARVGKKLRVTYKPLATYEKRGAIFSIYQSFVVDEDGLEIVKRFIYGGGGRYIAKG
ncbi:MaoC family dehydratase [Chloroflexota bacterium]